MRATMIRAARPVFNQSAFASQARATFTRQQQSTGFRFSQNGGRRWQSSTTGEGAAPKQSWFQMMWDSPVGVKTVHFWAPVMKWALVLAGISDLSRPAEKLSLTQNAALTATGLIWTRWCFVIKPKNYLYVNRSTLAVQWKYVLTKCLVQSRRCQLLPRRRRCHAAHPYCPLPPVTKGQARDH